MNEIKLLIVALSGSILLISCTNIEQVAGGGGESAFEGVDWSDNDEDSGGSSSGGSGNDDGSDDDGSDDDGSDDDGSDDDGPGDSDDCSGWDC